MDAIIGGAIIGCPVIGGTAVSGASVEDVVTYNRGDGGHQEADSDGRTYSTEGVLSRQASLIDSRYNNHTNPYMFMD